MNPIPESERRYLRELARRQAELAARPEMDERRTRWTAINDGNGADIPPVFVIETDTFDAEFMPPDVWRCVTSAGRAIEGQMLRHIRNFELIGDDKVVPATFDIGWHVSIDEFGVPIKAVGLNDDSTGSPAHRFEHPITDLECDFEKLMPAVCAVDRAATLAHKSRIEDLLDDILPVRIRTGTFGDTLLTYAVVRLMGMETFFLAMMDQPEAVHRLMAYLRDNALRTMRWAETEGLLRVNNEHETTCGSCCNFTQLLPRSPRAPDEPAVLADMWGYLNSQETVGVSPVFFHEFCFPYYCDVAEPLGGIYFGCCEPVHPIWDDVARLPHLRKVSISRWCDERAMGDTLRGSGIVYSRKPDPKFLSLDETLDETTWAAHLRETLDAARGCALEIIVRDVYTVHRNLENARRAAAVAHSVIGEHRRRHDNG